ncbi:MULTISPECIES: phospholipase D-like domain-containing protein [unclassified Paraburkholderia]|uniref:phospholipase D-like domain-containing protein n=1 Tax=unclassified Paraburkholderia TaxID=2615204 RepID=UPI002AB08FA8|nr:MULTISPECIES: phospholipase D-like domain-containing protein [unclassified Paraburkholderia]
MHKLKKQLVDVAYHQQDANNNLLGALQMQGMVDSAATQQRVADAQQKVAQLKQQRSQIESQMKSAPQEPMNRDYPGLKVQICTLVAPDSPAGKWVPVYVHAKLMTIDDAFMTLGSANINTRSMEADSELNICHENSQVTKTLRHQLWSLHTNNIGTQDKPGDAIDSWTDIVKQNTVRQQGGTQQPYASLVGFTRTSNVRSYSD